MNLIADAVRAERRLVILQGLKEAPDYRLGEGTLGTVLRHVGQSVPRDMLRTELQWLEENGLVRVERQSVPAELWVAELTREGQEVAVGVKAQHGVARPAAR